MLVGSNEHHHHTYYVVKESNIIKSDNKIEGLLGSLTDPFNRTLEVAENEINHDVPSLKIIQDTKEIETVNENVLKKLSICNTLQNLLDILNGVVEHVKYDYKSEVIHNQLIELKNKLPQEMQKNFPDLKKNQLLENMRLWKNSADAELKNFGFSESHDIGGHGGTSFAKVEIDGKVYSVFLKPLDEIEERNYKIINQLNPELGNFCPRIYGHAELNRKKYLVMENTRMSENGIVLNQLADIKLAGKIEGNEEFNPIADQEEMRVTRGMEKNLLDYTQMKFGADKSPDYMLAMGDKMFRFFRYADSENNLFEALKGFDSEALKKLSNDLKALETLIIESSIAFIGASIILIKQTDESIKPLLIDPAHIQVNENRRDEVNSILRDNEKEKIYYGNQEMFANRKKSNILGMRAFNTSILKLISSLTSKKVEEKVSEGFNFWEAFKFS